LQLQFDIVTTTDDAGFLLLYLVSPTGPVEAASRRCRLDPSLHGIRIHLKITKTIVVVGVALRHNLIHIRKKAKKKKRKVNNYRVSTSKEEKWHEQTEANDATFPRPAGVHASEPDRLQETVVDC